MVQLWSDDSWRLHDLYQWSVWMLRTNNLSLPLQLCIPGEELWISLQICWLSSVAWPAHWSAVSIATMKACPHCTLMTHWMRIKYTLVAFTLKHSRAKTCHGRKRGRPRQALPNTATWFAYTRGTDEWWLSGYSCSVDRPYGRPCLAKLLPTFLMPYGNAIYQQKSHTVDSGLDVIVTGSSFPHNDIF